MNFHKAFGLSLRVGHILLLSYHNLSATPDATLAGTYVSDGLPAAVAARAVVLREARHAVHAAVVLVELGTVDGLVARVAREVLRVPFLVQCLYDL